MIITYILTLIFNVSDPLGSRWNTVFVAGNLSNPLHLGIKKFPLRVYRRLTKIHSQRPLRRKRTITDYEKTSAYCPEEPFADNL
jgi:hypothetical protein